MKFKSIIGFGFGGIALVSAVTASALYLPQVKIGESFYGTQLVDNKTVYSQLNATQTNGVSVFGDNGNVANFIAGTPNVSLDILLNGTNDYSDGNYVVLFVSDGDPLSNLFLYGEAYRLYADKNSENTKDIVDFHKFGFSIDETTNQPVFDASSVVSDYSNGYIQSAFQYITSKKAWNIMSALPSIVLVHDKIDYNAMQSLIDYQDYVKSCLHDVVFSVEGKYSFVEGTDNYEQFKNNNPDLAPNYQAESSLELFQGLVGYDKNVKDTDDNYDENQKLYEEAETLNKEYEWAINLKNTDPVCFGFKFNPIDSVSLEVNTYTDPAGNTKPYRTDTGAKQYIEAIQQFKNKLSPSYISTTFSSQTNGGHYIGFAHSPSSEESVVLSDDLSSIPSSNLNLFAGESANSKFSASLISLYNGVSNSVYAGISLLDKYISSTGQLSFENNALITTNDKKLSSLTTWYVTK